MLLTSPDSPEKIDAAVKQVAGQGKLTHVLIVGDGGLRVEGSGSVWRVLPADQGVLVSTIGA